MRALPCLCAWPDLPVQELENCRLCKERFAATATQHAPRPVLWFQPGAKVLIAGQAPGARVHESGRPFTDPSGDRLRSWLDLDETGFYDKIRIAMNEPLDYKTYTFYQSSYIPQEPRPVAPSRERFPAVPRCSSSAAPGCPRIS